MFCHCGREGVYDLEKLAENWPILDSERRTSVKRINGRTGMCLQASRDDRTVLVPLCHTNVVGSAVVSRPPYELLPVPNAGTGSNGIELDEVEAEFRGSAHHVSVAGCEDRGAELDGSVGRIIVRIDRRAA